MSTEYCPPREDEHGWTVAPRPDAALWKKRDHLRATLSEMWDFPIVTEDLFKELADKWSRETEHISSVHELASHPSYRQIVRLGWSVVPFLLLDLQANQRFWFPALAEITGIRP